MTKELHLRYKARGTERKHSSLCVVHKEGSHSLKGAKIKVFDEEEQPNGGDHEKVHNDPAKESEVGGN